MFRKIWGIVVIFPLGLVLMLMEKITFLVASINIPLSKILFIFVELSALLLDKLAFGYPLGMHHLYVTQYKDKIKEIEKEQYDKLYSEMQKRKQEDIDRKAKIENEEANKNKDVHDDDAIKLLHESMVNAISTTNKDREAKLAAALAKKPYGRKEETTEEEENKKDV